MEQHDSQINLRALACLQRHEGHILVNCAYEPYRICRYCRTNYDVILNGTDPFVHFYHDRDITIRAISQKDICIGRTLDDLPDWYVRRYGRHQFT